MTTSIYVLSLCLLLLQTLAPTAAAAEGMHLVQASSKDILPGQIVVDPDHPQWLQRHGGQHVFICGPGDPEDFLYVGRRSPDGTRDGDQLARIAKLAEHGGNCIYMQMVRSHGGDAKGNGDPQWARQNPFVDGDPAQGLDEDILQQWEQWFTVMDRHEILIYLFFYDDSARIWNTGDTVGPQEQAFVETIVKRFMHHRNLIWVIGEESEERYTTARVQALARIIRSTDKHGHVIGNHHLSGTTFKAWQPAGALTHFAMQLGRTDDAAHAGAIEALQKAAGRYQVIYAESTAMRTDVDGMRSHAWSVAMAGMMPMLLRMDIATTPVEALQQCRHLQQFFEATDFWTMSAHDELRHEGTKYVLANPGHGYIAYADHLTRALGLKDLPASQYTATWMDCRTGKRVLVELAVPTSGDHAFDKPREIGGECALWLRPHVAASSQEQVKSASDGQPPARGVSAANRPPAVKDKQLTTPAGQQVFIQLSFEDEDGPGPYGYTILRAPAHGTLSGDDNDRFYSPQPGFTGTDEFTWKVNDGKADSEPATVVIHVGAASSPRPRLLVLTDIGGDPDDQQSLIRLMVHANEFEIEGLIATASGTPGELKERRTRPDLIREIVTAYGQVQPRLAEHAAGFPQAARLLAKVKSGNPNRGRAAVGDAYDTEGSRWRPAFQNEFAARMDWCVKSRAEANHPPLAVLNGDATRTILTLSAAPGEHVTLSAQGSRDPDGQPVRMHWFTYPEAGSYRGTISLFETTGETASFLVPSVEETETVHVILQVEDRGRPPLSAYRRAVVTVRRASADRYQSTASLNPSSNEVLASKPKYSLALETSRQRLG